MHLFARTLICFCFVLPFSAQAKEVQLKTMVRTTYPQNILASSVDELVRYILEGTEYRLYAGKNSPNDAKRILVKKSEYQKPGILMSRLDALLMAVGEQNSIIIDHDNKLISVTRDPLYDE